MQNFMNSEELEQKLNDELKTYSKEVVQEALEKSIEHWNQNLKRAINRYYSKITLSASSCDLCNLFFMDKNRNYIYPDILNRNNCKGCPVYEKTGYTKCEKTPYENVSDVYYNRNEYEQIEDLFQKDLIDAIKEEIEFLESLREEKDE